MYPSGSPCCKDKALLLAATAPIANQKLGIFRRLVRGDSFRVLPAEKGAGAGASSSPSGALSKFLPPARILDLSVEVDTEEQQIEFAWTAPGEDYDNGKVCLDAFVLFCGESPCARFPHFWVCVVAAPGFYRPLPACI